MVDQTESIKELKFKNKILIDDKNYYEGFVIATKRENKQIKKDIMKLYGTQDVDPNVMMNRPMDHVLDSETHDPSLLTQTKTVNPPLLQGPDGKTRELTKKDQHYMAKLESIQSEIDKLQRKSGYLRQKKLSSLQEKIELEQVFQKCIEEVKKDIYRKKMMASRQHQQFSSEIDFNKFTFNDKK